MVRYHTGGPLAEPPLTGLNPLSGRHDAGLSAGLLGAVVVGWRCRRASWLTVRRWPCRSGPRASSSERPPAAIRLLVDLSDPTELATVTIAGEFALLCRWRCARPQPDTRCWCARAPAALAAGHRGRAYRWSARPGWPSS